jgi:hypothetical protein
MSRMKLTIAAVLLIAAASAAYAESAVRIIAVSPVTFEQMEISGDQYRVIL